MTIRIIEANIDQLDSVTHLFNKYMIFYKKPSNEPIYKAYLKERIENKEATVYLAIDVNNTPLGFVLNYYAFSSVSLGKTITLNDLYVQPEYRKNGIAEQLIRKTFELAKSVGAIRVDLGTAKDNYSAQKLYERIGFTRDKQFYAYSYSM
ncbi:acetyltransferase (GNAT) family [Dokdonia sp. MED134]|uniref:GNAT family N-acetyltransferase n=1 Tax=Dokdonia sp. MED134 TaxID=313590 RepID=UPI0001F8153B|nr:GNAT family N-acetyltransferase [Dokdonia sp. MED134]EAQ39274.2 acetyltransferase (GNAT) family [Dokdonia sp. MED134]